MTILIASALLALPPTQAPAPVPRPERSEAARALLRERGARMAALPFASEWLPAVERARARVADQRWLVTSDGLLRDNALDQELLWNRPHEDRERPWSVDFEHPRHPFGCIVDFAEQLERQGIDLVVALVPTRLHTRPDLVVDGLELPRDFGGIARGLPEFQLALVERGVDVVDLLPALAGMHDAARPDGPEAFLRTNTHWTPEGARVAAEAVHAQLRQLPNFEPGPLIEGRDFVRRAETFAWTSGDEELPIEARPEPLPIVRVVHPDGEALELDRRQSPILVLGDSFVTFHQTHASGFFQHLAALVGRSLDVVAVNGLGAIGPRRTIRRRQAQDLAEKRIVVWVFTTIALVEPEQWRNVAFFDD